MACKGKCQVQLNDVDIEDLWYKLLPPPKGQPPSGCPSTPPETLMDDVQEYIKPYFEKLSGCEEEECDCVPVDDKPKWSDWQEYKTRDTNYSRIVIKRGNKTVTCDYLISGSYYVSSATVEGVCMRRSETAWDRRLRSNRPKWWKKKGEGNKEQPK